MLINIFKMFVYGLIILVLILLIHHRIKHNDSDISELNKWFEYEDINNHETCILVLLGMIVIIMINKYKFIN